MSEKTYIDEMSCEMIDEMSDAMVDDTKGRRRREFNDLGITGRPKVADSNKHSGGSHLCEDGDAHDAIEQRRSVDYRTVNSDRPQKTTVYTTQRSYQHPSQQGTQVSGKGVLLLILILMFVIGCFASSLPLVVISIILFVSVFSKKNNGSGRK
ncbi:MAG: hypothetical protein IJ071_04335 [Ruminococcus sp.]|nr:hypothetical protein [Ruminococcus sp.]